MTWYHRVKTGFQNVGSVTGRIVASNTFFGVVLAMFVAQALWIAVAGKFSMAYDEYFHIGVIREYAQQWSPWLQDVPAQTAQYGAISRDPSFFYHYVMSFPFRLFAAVVHSDMAQIIFLRLTSLVFFVAGLFVYRRLLLEAGIGKKLTHVVLLFFTLVPTFVMLAAQINYDNPAFLLAGLSLLMALRLIRKLQKGTLQIRDAVWYVTLLMTAGITKYALLPIIAAQVLFVGTYAIRYRRQLRVGAMRHDFTLQWRLPLNLLMMALFVLVGFLFVNRVGVNVVRYHTPAPRCEQVLTDAQCRLYDPYRRDARYRDFGLHEKVTAEDRQEYPRQWYIQMIWESFFVVGPREMIYPPQRALPGGWIAGWILTGTALVVIATHLLWLWRGKPHFQLFLLVCAVYVGALYWRNYHDYLRTGVEVAVHGRYVVFLMPLVGAMVAASLRRSLPRSWRVPAGVLLLLVLVMLISGGGWLPFILRSWDEWMWPWAVEPMRVLRDFFWQWIPLN